MPCLFVETRDPGAGPGSRRIAAIDFADAFHFDPHGVRSPQDRKNLGSNRRLAEQPAKASDESAAL